MEELDGNDLPIDIRSLYQFWLACSIKYDYKKLLKIIQEIDFLL